METSKMIETLKKLAATNKTANDVFHDFALRLRARSQVTVKALALRMKKQGFSHSVDTYAEILKALADCGLGELKTTNSGRVVGIFNIKPTLQSLGQAIVGKNTQVRRMTHRNKYVPLKAAPAEKREIVESLSGVPKLIRVIMEDTSVPADMRLDAVMALLK